jgi:predicted TIM-barrel fold metal-dependent hydrolase
MAPSTSDAIIDFHGHWFPPAVVNSRPANLAGVLKDAWPLLTDLEAQLDRAAADGTDVKVVNAVLSSIAPAAAVALDDLPSRTNDELAAAVAAHGPRLAALATVDPFRGDPGAEEARRAIDELGLAGLVLDAAQGERLLGDPETRPTLEFAAQRGVTVFAHPVNPPVLPPRYAGQGHVGVLLARGAESALSTLAILASDLLADLPELNIVLAGIGGAALLLSGFLAPDAAARRGRLHIDTMGFDPVAARFALDALGPERVLLGSDWPIVDRSASRQRVTDLVDDVSHDPRTRALIAGGNARRLLLGVGAAPELQEDVA